MRAQPERDAPRHALENAVSAGLPDALDVSLLPDLPVDAAPVPGALGTLVTPKAYLPTPASDPEQGRAFTKATYLYAPGGVLFCRAHYSSPEDAPLAGRIVRLLALAHRTLVAQTHAPPAGGDAPFDVWLCRTGRAGGEQWGRNLFFYDLDAPRSSIEWIREVAHEYSHLALPPVGGYKDPEYWASGYLGERLIIRWLQRTAGGPALVAQVWGDFGGAANFDHLLIDPPLALYRRIGPNARWLARTDAEGMRYLIGQTLTVDDKYGPRAVAEAFALLPHVANAADLADAFAQVAARHAVVRRP